MIATTIEQSKHLLELGLDPKTADCHWWYAEGEEYLYLGRDYDINELPAWSLSALLEVMPPFIEDDERGAHWFELDKEITSTNKVVYIFKYIFDAVEDIYKVKVERDKADIIDAAYEMVCWLLEQGLIKKGD